jgi:hypothetical protein
LVKSEPEVAVAVVVPKIPSRGEVAKVIPHIDGCPPTLSLPTAGAVVRRVAEERNGGGRPYLCENHHGLALDQARNCARVCTDKPLAVESHHEGHGLRSGAGLLAPVPLEGLLL